MILLFQMKNGIPSLKVWICSVSIIEIYGIELWRIIQKNVLVMSGMRFGLASSQILGPSSYLKAFLGDGLVKHKTILIIPNYMETTNRL